MALHNFLSLLALNIFLLLLRLSVLPSIHTISSGCHICFEKKTSCEIMSENDFIVDKNGILLDCPPGTLHLDENGIVQDTDYSVLQLPADYEDTQLSLYDFQPYQSFIRSSHLEHSWYGISDLEISDDEKNAVGPPENVPLKQTNNGRQSVYKDHVKISNVSPATQLLDYTQVINNDFPNSPLNSKTSPELLHYIYNDQDPLEVFMNQPNSSFQSNNNDTVTNYHTPAASNMYLYQKRDLLAESESSSKSSLSIPEGLTASERELYLQHATISQILDSSHNENYQSEEEQQVQDDDDDDVDDELFLITGHIDFGTHQSSRPGSANVLEYSSGLGQEMSRSPERNCPKNRVKKRSVSFDLLPQEQSFNPNEEIPSFAHDSMTISLPDNLQDKNALFNQKRSQDQCYETNQCHPDFDKNISERHSGQFQEIKNVSNSFFNEDISVNSDSNLINRKSLVRSEVLKSSYSQYSSDEKFQVFHDQKISAIPENLSGQSKFVNQKNMEEMEKHQKEIETTMDKLGNSGHSEMEEGSLSKSKMDDSMKSFRAKSKSTTNISSPLTPIKSKYKSLSELSNIPTDGDDSIKDLNAKLEEELSKRKKATQLVEQLQNRYDNLLTRYADAEMMIDELRIGSKMAPKIPDFKSSQSPITNLIMNRALVTSTPMASTFSMNQSLRDDDDRLPLSASVILNDSEGNTKTNKQNDEPLTKSGKIKEHLLVQAKHLESKINTLVSLLEKRQLTAKELKKVFDNIKSEQDKQRREYLRVKEEFQIIQTNNDEVFDKDKELEGFLFQLQMRFDELEDKHKHLQENQKEPFQEMADQETETDTCPKIVANLQSKDEVEKKRQKFLSQYNSLMERYQRLKISGNLNENDEEVKEIKKKLQEISEELCLNEQEHQKLTISSDPGGKIKKSPTVKNLISGHNVGLLEENQKTNTRNGNQRVASSHSKKLDQKTSRIVRSLPAPPKDSHETSNKKSDEVSSSTSVPDSGIFEELNGMSHHHPSVRLASSRGQRVQSSVPVHTESSDGPAAMDNSPRVSLAPNRQQNSSGLAEISSQSTEATLLNSHIDGDDSFLWQPTMTALHKFSGHGRSTESEAIEYSSENSDQTDLDTSERSVLIRRARPKSILRRKYKPSKSQPPSTQKIDQKSEQIKHNAFTAGSRLQQRQSSKSNTSSFEKIERKKQRQRSSSLDSQKPKPTEQLPEIKSSNKEKLRNLQLEIESLKARFNNGMPWKNATVISNSKNDGCLGEISSTGTNLPSSNSIMFSPSPNIYHNNVPQDILYQTKVRSSPEDIYWKNPSPIGSYRRISNFNSIDVSNPTSVNNSNTVMTSPESLTPYRVQNDQNTCVTLLDYHSPVLHKKVPPKSLPPKSLVSSEPEHRSNYPFYLSNPNNNLPSARSFQDISQIQTDPTLHVKQKQYKVLSQSSDYYQSTNNLTPEPVCYPSYNQLEDIHCLKGQTVFNPPHYTHNPYRVPAALLHSDTFQRQSSYNPEPNAINRNATLQFSRNCTPIPHSVKPICDICGMSGCSHNYVTEVNYTPPAQRGTISVPASTYSVYNSQNMRLEQRNHSDYRNYQLVDGDLTESINLAEKTIEDINHLTRKMMRTMHEELIKSKRNYDIFYHF